MPRMLATSSVASAGMSRVAARSSALLCEPRRRLPDIPSSLVMLLPRAPQRALQASGLQPRCVGGCPLAGEFRRDAPIGLAEGNAFAQHEAVGLLGGMYRGIETDRLRMKLERCDGRRQN